MRECDVKVNLELLAARGVDVKLRRYLGLHVVRKLREKEDQDDEAADNGHCAEARE